MQEFHPQLLSNQHQILSNVIPDAVIADWRNKADAAYESLYEDYFSSNSKEAYYYNNFGHTSPIARLGAWRMFGSTMFRELKKNFLTPFGVSSEQYYFMPLFYLRFTFPELYDSSPNHKNAFLCSQPHYDRAFGIHARTFWVPLMDVSEATGGICFFYDEATIEIFSPQNGKNAYNYTKYLEHYNNLDPILSPECQAPLFPLGSVATFNSNILHGAKKAIGAWRRSFDFRIFDRPQFEKLDARVKKIVRLVNLDPDILTILSLAYFCDDAGVERALAVKAKNESSILIEKALTKIRSVRPLFDICNPSSLIPYQSEYEWVDAVIEP